MCCFQLHDKNNTISDDVPIVSRLGETGMAPRLETAAYEGRKARVPQYPAGILTPPMASIPTYAHKSKKMFFVLSFYNTSIPREI